MRNLGPDKEIRFEWPAETRTGSRESTAGSVSLAGDAAAGAEQTTVGERPSHVRVGLWWSCYLGAWCTVLLLGTVAALRIFDPDGTFVLIWLNAFTRYVYLPAYVCVAWGAWQRRWFLALAGLAVVACHVTWLIPDFVRDRRFDSPSSVAGAAADRSPALRVFFANVAARNGEHAALLNEIAAANPDVVVLVEFSWPWHIAFKAAPVMVPYKYGAGWLQSHIGSVNVFSKVPLETETQNWVMGRAVHTVDIRLGTQTLRLIGLHGPRPIGLPMHNYHQYWNEMVALLTNEREPLVIVGDFNATEHSLVYQQLTAGRLRSAHNDRGRGYATTWPNGRYWLPPIRIDQAFVSPQVECVRIEEGVGRGSDHKSLIMDVRIRDQGVADETTAATTGL